MYPLKMLVNLISQPDAIWRATCHIFIKDL